MVIDVLASAVTLSPIEMDTGLRSFDSIAFGFFGVLKTGLECPMKDLTLQSKNELLTTSNKLLD